MNDKLLYTGASGFLGYNTLPQLRERYDVTTLGQTERDMIRCDLATNVPPLSERYDVVLHAAGKAHIIPRTEEERRAFYEVNVGGTRHLCEALEQVGVPRAFIFISTVAVYGLEAGEEIGEEHPLNGGTPYADSKIEAEHFLEGWCAKHQVVLTILRPSLLAGMRATGNLGDMINGIRKGFYLNIGKGDARRSVSMAADISRLLPMVQDKGGVYNLADNHQPSFGELSVHIAQLMGKKPPISIPLWIAKIMARVGDMLGKKSPFNSTKLNKMTHSLTFSNRKLRTEIGFEPSEVLKELKIGRG